MVWKTLRRKLNKNEGNKNEGTSKLFLRHSTLVLIVIDIEFIHNIDYYKNQCDMSNSTSVTIRTKPSCSKLKLHTIPIKHPKTTKVIKIVLKPYFFHFSPTYTYLWKYLRFKNDTIEFFIITTTIKNQVSKKWSFQPYLKNTCKVTKWLKFWL